MGLCYYACGLWPIPITTMHKDISHVPSGAAVHLAAQISLHIPGNGRTSNLIRAASRCSTGHTFGCNVSWYSMAITPNFRAALRSHV